MDYGLLNIGSIVLGLIAFVLPVINLIRYNNSNNQYWFVFALMSIVSCMLSLGMQIFYINHLISLKDWTAIMDTINIVVFSAALLLVATTVLNGVTLFAYIGNRKKK
ncbi:hypothetical protein [Romboutsia lituseburensis]|uniref:hypothetical protein n=1 Tax=Romboutsia lituseburensis TaxID=1537 RepID=UPI00215A3685|nr:hypothetical protein [Romboutsia lituseburensis]MCR8746903.1 hypothetical protein [Romboutsia lituseburensis]